MVHFFGCMSGYQTGQLINPCKSEAEHFRYDDGTFVSYEGLMVIGVPGEATLSQKGDSGAVVFDEHHRAIGLLIGGNDQYTFALPIWSILQHARCTIVT